MNIKENIYYRYDFVHGIDIVIKFWRERMKKKDFMKKLLYFMKDYKKESVLAPLFKMLEAFFELFVPLVVCIDHWRGIVPKDSGHIIRMCLLPSGISSSGIDMFYYAQYFAGKVCCWSGNRDSLWIIYPYSDIRLWGDGYGRNIYIDYSYDKWY